MDHGWFRRALLRRAKARRSGKEYDVQVTELSRQGDGVAKIHGFVIFVQRVKVGQKVRIKIDRVGPRFANATIVGYT
ncbi:MAG: TRAM domain-containing protein [Nitrososphaerota archaeon]|nr:TRAM domain-containing protein [Nitrososphaerota archaeon]